MPTASEIYNRAKGTDATIAADQAKLLADQAEGTVEHQELYDVVAAYPGPVVEVDADQVHAMILTNDPSTQGKTFTTAAYLSTAPPPPPQPPGTSPAPPPPPTDTGTTPAQPPTDTGTGTPDTGTAPPPPPPTDTGTMPAAGGPRPDAGPNPPGQYAFRRGTPPRPPTQPPPAQGT